MTNSLVFQRGAGSSTQIISYWAGSSVGDKGGPVPAFVNPPQPAWVDIAVQGSHKIEYAAKQPTSSQTVFFNIITDNNKENPIGVVSFTLAGDGSLTQDSNTCPSSVVVKNEGTYWAIMMPVSL